MKEPWTPGPWIDLGSSQFRGRLIGGASREAPEGLVSDDGLIHTAVAEALDGVETPTEANARLIAAAPEMAELLATLSTKHKHDENCGPAMRRTCRRNYLLGSDVKAEIAVLLSRIRGEA
jgi:hypothetical protein